MSTTVAGLAAKKGYTNVRVFLDGQPAWIKDGNLVYASKGFVAKGNIVLIDLRASKKAAEGRIARAVSIPYDALEDRMEDIPVKAPIVVYSDSAEEMADAYEDLRDEGYKKVALVSGGFAGWTKGGGETVKGTVDTEINWVRKLAKGEVAQDDFIKVIKGEVTDTIILDVRTADEAASGGFPGAVAIPLDEIGSRHGEIPKDKKIFVHCTTGARAEMASKELKSKGFKDVFYLVANCECEGDKWKFED